jgi:hypothetical protein
MGAQIYLNLWYLVPRVLVWLALFGAALADGILHRQKNRGWQLHRGIVVVLGVTCLQDVLLLVYAAGYRHAWAGTVFSVYIFFTDLADAMFIALLLTIAAGYCITRENVGPYLLKVVLIPAIYLTTTLVVDYIINAVQGRLAFDATGSAPDVALDSNFTGNEWFALNICEFASLGALLLAWVYIFDTAQKEREALEGPKEGIVGAQGIQDPEQGVTHTTTVFPPNQGIASGAANKADEGSSGQAIRLPVEVEQQGDLRDVYAQVHEEDTDQPKTVQDRMLTSSKIRLMRQFTWGVAGYVIATAAVILLPVFVMVEPGDSALRAILIGQNIVLWCFLAALAWIFRPREDNPYLMLDEGAEDQPEGLHTEISFTEGASDEALGSRPGRSSPSLRNNIRITRAEDSPGSVDQHFTLGDLDDEEELEMVAMRQGEDSSLQGKQPQQQPSPKWDGRDSSSIQRGSPRLGGGSRSGSPFARDLSRQHSSNASLSGAAAAPAESPVPRPSLPAKKEAGKKD